MIYKLGDRVSYQCLRSLLVQVLIRLTVLYRDMHLIGTLGVNGGRAWGEMEIGPTVCVDTRVRTCFLSNTDNICRYFRENVTGQDARFEKMGEIGPV